MKEIADYKPIIIGVDHGYGNIKTEHCVFPSGVVTRTLLPGFVPSTTITFSCWG